MIILLSSAHRPRYREDILRCLAAPIGTRLQFRYDIKHVQQNLADNVDSIAGDALVCFIDNSLEGICPLLPVRKVSITRLRRHGSTISIVFSVADFAHQRPDDFTSEITKSVGGVNPRKTNNIVSGSFLFSLDSVPSELTLTKDVSAFEATADALVKFEPFQQEAFFWSVLGVVKSGETHDSTEQTTSLPDKLDAKSDYELLLYHYHPSPPFPDQRHRVSIACGGEIKSSDLTTIPIDSRYDLKSLAVRTGGARWSKRTGKIRVGQEGAWSLDIRVVIKPTLFQSIVFGILIGLSIAASSVTALIGSDQVSVASVTWAIIFGLVAGFFVIWGTDPS